VTRRAKKTGQVMTFVRRMSFRGKVCRNISQVWLVVTSVLFPRTFIRYIESALVKSGCSVTLDEDARSLL